MENLTFMEPMASREQEEVVMVPSMIHARARNLGIPVCLLHTDREKSFATKAIFISLALMEGGESPPLFIF